MTPVADASRVERGLQAVEAPIRALGRLAAWLVLATVLIVAAVVILRYGFGWGRIWLQELYVWLAAAAFMLAAPAALANDAHVRIDIFYARRGPRFRALVDLLGSFLLLAPFATLLLVTSASYVRQSWALREASREAGGLPGVFILKSLIPLLAVLLLVQASVIVVRAIRTLRAQRS